MLPKINEMFVREGKNLPKHFDHYFHHQELKTLGSMVNYIDPRHNNVWSTKQNALSTSLASFQKYANKMQTVSINLAKSQYKLITDIISRFGMH